MSVCNDVMCVTILHVQVHGMISNAKFMYYDFVPDFAIYIILAGVHYMQ